MNTKAATLTATALVIIASLTGCGSSAPAGKAEVHERIKAETNCSKLQADFDLADKNGKLARDNGKLDLANANTAYMTTAHERQKELKCFE